MYVPAHFAAPDDALAQLLAAPGAVDLVSTTAEGLTATTLPMLYDSASGTLVGHLRRRLQQHRRAGPDRLMEGVARRLRLHAHRHAVPGGHRGCHRRRQRGAGEPVADR